VRDRQQRANVTRRATVALADRQRIAGLNRLRATQSVFFAMTELCKGRRASFEPAKAAVRAVRAGKYRATSARPSRGRQRSNPPTRGGAMTKRLRIAVLGAALAVVALAAGPPVVSAITATLFTTSTLEEPVNVNNDRIRLKIKDPADMHVQEASFQPAMWSTGTTTRASR
jgi:hypothetical protein